MSGNRGYIEKIPIWQVSLVAATSHNKQFAKIAALPSLENICYFRRVLLVGKCVKAATSASCRHVVGNLGKRHIYKSFLYFCIK